MTRRFAVIVVLLLVAGTMASPLGATGFAQRCDGPPSSTQAGRATLAPGVNRKAASQKITVNVNLWDCSPRRATRGAGILKSTLVPSGPQSCTLFTVPKVLKASAKISWKDQYTSTLALTFSLTGKTQRVDVKGKVTSGLFKNHVVTGQLAYKELVTPISNGRESERVSQACSNYVAPKQHGRIAISAISLFTTKHFVIS